MTDLNKLEAAPEPTIAELQEWEATVTRMAQDKDREMVLRKKIAAFYFPEPKEGTNNAKFPHAEGWVVKMVHKITRKLLLPELTAKTEEFAKAGLPLSTLIVPKYELSDSAYKKLTEEQQKMFDAVLETKDGSPTVTIVKPKKAA